VSWTQLEAEAPELARLGRERLASGLALLGTVRADGSPRVSPIGVFFLDGELVIGVMTRSGKARDLRRDHRVALQSVVTAPDEGEPELKLYGRVSASDADGGWWERGRPGVDVYAVALDEAVYVEWDLLGAMLALRRWRPGRGEVVTERAYP
jgi:hypothetical protein